MDFSGDQSPGTPRQQAPRSYRHRQRFPLKGSPLVHTEPRRRTHPHPRPQLRGPCRGPWPRKPRSVICTKGRRQVATGSTGVSRGSLHRNWDTGNRGQGTGTRTGGRGCESCRKALGRDLATGSRAPASPDGDRVVRVSFLAEAAVPTIVGYGSSVLGGRGSWGGPQRAPQAGRPGASSGATSPRSEGGSLGLCHLQRHLPPWPMVASPRTCVWVSLLQGHQSPDWAHLTPARPYLN